MAFIQVETFTRQKKLITSTYFDNSQISHITYEPAKKEAKVFLVSKTYPIYIDMIEENDIRELIACNNSKRFTHILKNQ